MLTIPYTRPADGKLTSAARSMILRTLGSLTHVTANKRRLLNEPRPIGYHRALLWRHLIWRVTDHHRWPNLLCLSWITVSRSLEGGSWLPRQNRSAHSVLIRSLNFQPKAPHRRRIQSARAPKRKNPMCFLSSPAARKSRWLPCRWFASLRKLPRAFSQIPKCQRMFFPLWSAFAYEAIIVANLLRVSHAKQSKHSHFDSFNLC